VADSIEGERNQLGNEFRVRVKVHVRRKRFRFEYEQVDVMPTVSGMIIMALQKLAKTKSTREIRHEASYFGDLEGRLVVEIAMLNRPYSKARSLKLAVKEVLGTIQSLGPITIDERSVQETLRMVDEGEWDEMISEVTSITPW